MATTPMPTTEHKHLNLHHRIALAASVPRPSEVGAMWSRAKADGHSFNGRVAVVICAVLGSMPFFWFSCVLALISLPAILTAVDQEVTHIGLHSFFPSILLKVSLIALIAWIAQTFIQLVALSILQVSNNAQMAQVERGLTVITDHTTQTVDALDLKTEGGLRQVRDELIGHIDETVGRIGKPPPAP